MAKTTFEAVSVFIGKLSIFKNNLKIFLLDYLSRDISYISNVRIEGCVHPKTELLVLGNGSEISGVEDKQYDDVWDAVNKASMQYIEQIKKDNSEYSKNFIRDYMGRFHKARKQ